MKRHILMITVAALFFGTQVNAMDQKKKRSPIPKLLRQYDISE